MGRVRGGHLLLQHAAVQRERQDHPRPGQPHHQRPASVESVTVTLRKCQTVRRPEAI